MKKKTVFFLISQIYGILMTALIIVSFFPKLIINIAKLAQQVLQILDIHYSIGMMILVVFLSFTFYATLSFGGKSYWDPCL